MQTEARLDRLSTEMIETILGCFSETKKATLHLFDMKRLQMTCKRLSCVLRAACSRWRSDLSFVYREAYIVLESQYMEFPNMYHSSRFLNMRCSFPQVLAITPYASYARQWDPTDGEYTHTGVCCPQITPYRLTDGLFMKKAEEVFYLTCDYGSIVRGSTGEIVLMANTVRDSLGKKQGMLQSFPEYRLRVVGPQYDEFIEIEATCVWYVNSTTLLCYCHSGYEDLENPKFRFFDTDRRSYSKFMINDGDFPTQERERPYLMELLGNDLVVISRDTKNTWRLYMISFKSGKAVWSNKPIPDKLQSALDYGVESITHTVFFCRKSGRHCLRLYRKSRNEERMLTVKHFDFYVDCLFAQ